MIGYTKELDGSIVIEKLDTTLDQRLKEPPQLTLFQKLVVMKHIAQALTYLHGLARSILHLNIQPSSIQLGSKAGIIAKLSQFGVCGYAEDLDPRVKEALAREVGENLESDKLPLAPYDVGTSPSDYSSSSSANTNGVSFAASSSPRSAQEAALVGAASSSSSSSFPSSSSSSTPSSQFKAPTAQILVRLRGAPLYNPPEAFRGEPYTTKSDVYSFGLTMTELMCGGSPFIAVKSLAGLMQAIQSAPIFPEDLPGVVCDLLARCREVDATKRPSFPEVLSAINDMFVPIFVHENVGWARNFWLDHFSSSCISVRWSDFAACFIRALGLPTSPNEITFRGVQKSKENASGIATRRMHCLKQLFFPGLTEDADFMKAINLWIDIDKYGHIMGTFSDENTKLENFLDGLAALIETRWFHGDATGSSGPHRLTPDTFLIRLSAPTQNSLRPPNCWFTFSLKTSAGNFVRETRIQRHPGRAECILANSAREVFPSLYALAETKGKPYGLAPVPSFLQSTLHPVSSEYTTDDDDEEL